MLNIVQLFLRIAAAGIILPKMARKILVYPSVCNVAQCSFVSKKQILNWNQDEVNINKKHWMIPPIPSIIYGEIGQQSGFC